MVTKKGVILNFFHWIRCSVTKIFAVTVKGLKHATSLVRDQDATTAPARHKWETGSLNSTQFCLQWFIRFPELTEFNENSAAFRKNSTGNFPSSGLTWKAINPIEKTVNPYHTSRISPILCCVSSVTKVMLLHFIHTLLSVTKVSNTIVLQNSATLHAFLI